MLPKKNRVTTAEFNQYFTTRKRVHGTYVQILYTPSTEFKAAAVVGKKVYKKAVDRNKLRRRMYHILAEQKKQLSITGVFLCIAKPAAATGPFTVIAADIRELISSIIKSEVK